MKMLLAALLIGCLSVGSLRAQGFKNAQAFGEWVMAYQENPEPAKLYPAFAFGVSNKELARAGGRHLLMAFFGSLFRADSSLIPAFYERVKQSTAENTQYGFVGALWMANTATSQRYLDAYLRSGRAEKVKDTETFNTPPFNIYRDSITQPEHLDLIWADFFATGNPADIRRIASALSVGGPLATAAKWSLTSNGVRYPNPRRLVQSEAKENPHPEVRHQLALIVTEMANELKKP